MFTYDNMLQLFAVLLLMLTIAGVSNAIDITEKIGD